MLLPTQQRLEPTQEHAVLLTHTHLCLFLLFYLKTREAARNSLLLSNPHSHEQSPQQL